MIITHALTFTGRMVDPLNLRVEDVHEADVAHALAHVNRFGGHARRAYSVAQHSLACSRLAAVLDRSTVAQLAALLHDAAEAYLGDVIAPIKGRDGFEIVDRTERRAIAVIWQALCPGVPLSFWYAEQPAVKLCDDLVLGAERYALLPPHPGWEPAFDETANGVVASVLPLTPAEAALLFSTRLAYLVRQL